MREGNRCRKIVGGEVDVVGVYGGGGGNVRRSGRKMTLGGGEERKSVWRSRESEREGEEEVMTTKQRSRNSIRE